MALIRMTRYIQGSANFQSLVLVSELNDALPHSATSAVDADDCLHVVLQHLRNDFKRLDDLLQVIWNLNGTIREQRLCAVVRHCNIRILELVPGENTDGALIGPDDALLP